MQAGETGDRERDIEAVVRRYTGILERWVRAYPEQYFWHHRRWKHQPPAAAVVGRMPRVGLYSPWSGSMDEGWMRWVLDTWGVPYVSVKNEMLATPS